MVRDAPDSYRKKTVTTKVKKNPKKRVTVVQDKGEGSHAEDRREAYLRAQQEAAIKRKETRLRSRGTGAEEGRTHFRTSKPLYKTEK